MIHNINPYALRAAIGRPQTRLQSLLQQITPGGRARSILESSRWSHTKNVTPGIDLSVYNYRVDPAVLKAAGVKFAILRTGIGGDYEDPTFPERCQAFYDADIPVMAYHVYVPGLVDNKPGNTSLHIKLLQKILKNKRIYALWWDNEIYKDASGRIIDPYWLENWCKDVIDTSINEFGASVNGNVGMYSARWFIEQYAPNITNWIHNPQYLRWMAQYPYPAGTVTTTWEDLDANHYPAENTKIWLPGVVTALDCWQFSGDRFKLPGVYANATGALGAVDLNMIQLPFAQFCEKYHYTPRVDPPPPPDDGDQEPPIPPPPSGTMDADVRRIREILEKSKLMGV